MKKAVSVLLAAAVVFTLAACNSNAPASTGESVTDSDIEAMTSIVDTDTLAVDAIVLARDDVSSDEIYAFVSTIYENADEIAELHVMGEELDLAYAAGVMSVPYHPGAAKYFEEKGHPVLDVKSGAGGGSTRNLLLGTGGESGTYYEYGDVLASFITDSKDFSVTAITSDGSQENIQDLLDDDVQLAFAQSDVMSYAYNGERLFEEKMAGFSVVCALYMEQVQIVTTDPSIKTVKDLAGKNVSVGAEGSGVYFNALDCLDAYGLTEDDIKPVYQSFGDSAESLENGDIDAAFIVAGAPTTAISDLAESKQIYLVGIEKEYSDKLIEESPYYSAYTIPAGTY